MEFLRSFQPRLTSSSAANAERISSTLSQEFSAFELDQKYCEGVLSTPKKLYKQVDVYQEFLLKHPEKIELCRLIKMMLCFSTNSAGPERLFSLQNRLKTKSRNRMSDLTLNDAMHIVANSVSQSRMDFVAAAKMVFEELPPEL
jgi:hypothetical protein